MIPFSSEMSCDRSQGGLNVTRLEAHLRAREAKRRESSGGVRLVPQAVPRLLGRRAVIAQAIGLDHQAEVGPVEVDLEAIDAAGLRLRESGPPGEWQEASLELRVGEHERPPVERLAHRGHARPAA